jgi:Ser/Thr protein kinase RdoA (MazF antagonist)
VRPLKLEITLAEAEQWARELYGIEATGSELPGEIDRNVLLTAADGHRWVLKLAPVGADRTELECQLAVPDANRIGPSPRKETTLARDSQLALPPLGSTRSGRQWGHGAPVVW